MIMDLKQNEDLWRVGMELLAKREGHAPRVFCERRIPPRGERSGRAVATKTTREIVAALRGEAKSTRQLSEAFNLTTKSVSNRLQSLEAANVVQRVGLEEHAKGRAASMWGLGSGGNEWLTSYGIGQ